MNPELVSEERLEDLFAKHKAKESPAGWTLQAYVCVQKEAFLEGARAALEELGILQVIEIPPGSYKCKTCSQHREGSLSSCRLPSACPSQGAILVKAKDRVT